MTHQTRARLIADIEDIHDSICDGLDNWNTELEDDQ